MMVGVLALLFVASLVSGCGTISGTTESGSGDRMIAADVRDRLAGDPVTGSCVIGVSVTDGVVTLRGTVPDESVHLRAKGVVRGTDGVKGIVDNLNVQ